MNDTSTISAQSPQVVDLESVVIRFAGDSGDGMQLTGTQFTDAAAFLGNDVATFPDYPAEIRAPAGTTAGVSAFQLQFASMDVKTPGDEVDVLVAMNVAALKVNLPDLKKGGILLVDIDGFGPKDLEKAGSTTNPLEDGSLADYRVISLDITALTTAAVAEAEVGAKAAGRCKNFYTLGMMYWLYDRPYDITLEWIQKKFAAKNPAIAKANALALVAGHNYCDTAEIFANHFRVEKASTPPGTYRRISGNEAAAMGLIAAGVQSGRQLFLGSYPITPASDILHELAANKHFGVRTFQAEDEIAGIASAIGAAYTGALAITTTSGPGMCLKSEGLNLAVMAELPLVIIDVQRGGPSTGLPTKTEQSDLLQALYGRNGDSPVPVLAASGPGDCFWTALEAAKTALHSMTPVIMLSDGYIGNGAEPWRIPSVEELPDLHVENHTDPETFKPYRRDERGARPWAVPGTPGLEHRIGGIEKQSVTGNISYDSENHQKMTLERHAKVAKIADELPPTKVEGNAEADVVLVSWGGTYGAVSSAVDVLNASGTKMAHVHLRWINPLPKDLGAVLAKFKTILVPELNMGQLRLYLSGKFGLPMQGINKVKGKPFKVNELVEQVQAHLKETK
jgi:2-oxoglutarate ferredoxin oxidoreductase subunit alpha